MIHDKKSRTRKVFGRRTATIDGKQYRFELHADGLHVRRLHSRQPVILAFSTILERLKIQFDLPLQETFTVNKPNHAQRTWFCFLASIGGL